MHMSDALVSPAVAAVTGVLSLTLAGAAVRHTGREERPERALPLMGAMGAFVFAAQLVNFAIPGTGSSGHLVGGILLAAVLGPWAAALTLTAVLFLQCLLFADGGLLALGCNVFNMAVLSTLVAYPLLFRPIAGQRPTPGRIFAASLTAGVGALALGAVAVAIETEASGITVLPLGRFLLFMLPIHLLIGIGEGLATGAVLCTLRRFRPDLIAPARPAARPGSRTPAILALAALAVAGTFTWTASELPDGLEWSVERVAGPDAPTETPDGLHRAAAGVQERTALLPDYGTSFAGLVGSGLLLVAALGLSRLLHPGTKRPCGRD